MCWCLVFICSQIFADVSNFCWSGIFFSWLVNVFKWDVASIGFLGFYWLIFHLGTYHIQMSLNKTCAFSISHAACHWLSAFLGHGPIHLTGRNSSRLNSIETKYGNIVHTAILHMCVFVTLSQGCHSDDITCLQFCNFVSEKVVMLKHGTNSVIF